MPYSHPKLIGLEVEARVEGTDREFFLGETVQLTNGVTD